MLNTVETRPLKVAIVHHNGETRSGLGDILLGQGLDVVLNTAFVPDLPDLLARNGADVLLVDLEDGEALQKEYLDTLFERLDIPIVFSDSDVTLKNGQTEEELGRKLSNKLTSLFRRGARIDKDSDRTPESPAHHNATESQGGDVGHIAVETAKPAGSVNHDIPARRVWVLTGSMGGIEAIRRFLSALPGDLPIGFIIAQYLGENVVTLASRLFAAGTSYHVQPPEAGHSIRHQDVIILPLVDEALMIDELGKINLVPPSTSSDITPAIDKILTMVAKKYGRNAGAIVFSGIGRTGIEGCNAITDHGGVVWTQDSESSRFPSTPQYIRDACQVSYSATPELLAEHLAVTLRAIESTRENAGQT